MAKRPIIRYGDRTTHGGTVITADMTWDIDGKSAARVGDQVMCPRCKGTFPIVTGAPSVFSSSPVARHGDTTACGAVLLASQTNTTIDDDSVDAAVPAPPLPVNLSSPANHEETHRIRFQAISPETEAPEPKCTYIMTRENGAQQGGSTDKDGFTDFVKTAGAEQVAVHFFFKSPKGEDIEREKLKA